MPWLDNTEKKYPVDLPVGQANLTVPQIEEVIKHHIRNSSALMRIFDKFEVSPDRLDDLTIEIADLEKKYAETDSEKMILNTMLFEGGSFFEDYFFVVAHEVVHWLSRIKEEEAYLNDPEEVLGFCSAIAYELGCGTDFDTIYNRIYPKISWHFHNELDAREFFSNMLEKAKGLLSR